MAVFVGTPATRYRHDVVIVGARAAGAATALLLARLGHDVVLLDRSVFPADTISTHQIARTGVVHLKRWGLLDDVLNSGAPAIRQVTYSTATESVTRPVAERAGVDLLVAARRYIVDTILAEAAARAGVDVRFGVTVDRVRLDEAGRVCCSTSDAHRARRQAPSREEAFALQLHRTAPDLANRLRHGRRTTEVAGMLRTPNVVRKPRGPGWALVGDAGYHRDAVTGHAISDAYRDAELLAVALDRALRGETDEASAMADYHDQRDRALRAVFELTCAMASFPPAPEFVSLLKLLSIRIDIQAAEVAARPVPGGRRLLALTTSGAR